MVSGCRLEVPVTSCLNQQCGFGAGTMAGVQTITLHACVDLFFLYLFLHFMTCPTIFVFCILRYSWEFKSLYCPLADHRSSWLVQRALMQFDWPLPNQTISIIFFRATTRWFDHRTFSPRTHGVFVELPIRLYGGSQSARCQRCGRDTQAVPKRFSIQLVR